ncbi:MAG: M18 family aminopeptidase [Gammaproteobacteria bacterium]|nr:M18 family aminopeptidase [Gammaproteobacteria bacterium]MCP5201131.1 M18 family aminopeptidase [Gammaproteobacteria bacterium]
MSKSRFDQDLLAFLDASPSPFHAVAAMRRRLDAAGFTALDEGEAWALAPRGRYYVTRNDSSLVAFRLGAGGIEADGLRMVGAHTDSPCLKLKPNAVLESHGYLRFGVEVYGGVLLNPWFDRDLSIAGRVTTRNRAGRLSSTLVDFERPVAVIPSLAIHLDREANDKRTVNKQTMLPPVLALAGSGGFDLAATLKARLKAMKSPLAREELLDFELMLYDTQRAAVVGLNEEFVAAARLDNLLSCHTGLSALIDAPAGHAQLFVANDHEEVGSGSTSGARGNFLRSVLERIAGSDEALARAIVRSLLISTDNAHGIHPNFADKHDGRHGPLLNAGPVIKVNANQAYATNSESAAIARHAAALAEVAVQSFVTRTDMGCGSTIGPLTATALGVRTVDIGVPTFAMHSIRELAGRDDAWALYRLLGAFYGLPDLGVRRA